ncbi:MAG TPA: hypothetical protein VMV92_41510 [Streptosporangiaceae bacterium]|nr:hypothetical protein [Streptosporangiaceae bacterium]
MNYDQPRPLKDGGWHYTSMNAVRVHPIGYCASHGPHATGDDARRCYRDYELNERLRLDFTIGHWNPCEAPSGCETLTNRQAGVMPWGPSWLLCDEHRTKEVAAELYGELAGDSVHS